MRTIMLMFDTLNRRMLAPYGCAWTRTPSFSRLSEHTVTFDNCYSGSLPCIPARREMHTGRYNFLHRSWGPLEPFDDSIPEMLKDSGVYTHLISDHQHYWEDGGATYHHRYNTWEIVRGQEGDRWKAQVRDPEIPEHLGRLWRQDVINREYFKSSDEQPLGQVFKLGFEFLERNKDADNWFLQLECCDPHEPFFTASGKYKELFPDDYDGPQYDWPDYGDVTEPEPAVRHLRNHYAALLCLCDEYLGKLLDYMDLNDMWKDTCLIVNTDHGVLLSEHNAWGKNIHPCYDEVVHIPLFIWNPIYGLKGVRRSSLLQAVDVMVTLLGWYGLDKTKDMEGKSIEPILLEDKGEREYALFGVHGGQVNITDGRYVYMRSPQDGAEVFNYTLMPMHMRRMFSVEELKTMTLTEPFSFTKGASILKVASSEGNKGDIAPLHNTESMLFDLKSDPGQLHPLHDEVVESRMLAAMIRMMKENDAPLEQYERLGLGNS